MAKARHRVVHVALLTLVAVATGGVATCAFGQGPGPMKADDVVLNSTVPYKVRDVKVDQKLGDKIPLSLWMTDSNGQRVKTGYFFNGNKPTIITLNYSNCPMLCNVQLNALAQSLDKMSLQINQDFQLLSVSIDPTESSDQAKKTKQKYVDLLERNQPGVSKGWEFCTAKQPVIDVLADTLGFRYTYDRQSGEYYHPAMLAFVSPEGVITRYSLGVDFPPDQMKKALIEAGDGTVGTKVEQVLLWCFDYDESSNRYTPVAWKLMRLGGLVTIGVVLACLTPFWIGRKRLPPPIEKTTEQSTELQSSETTENESLS